MSAAANTSLHPPTAGRVLAAPSLRSSEIHQVTLPDRQDNPLCHRVLDRGTLGTTDAQRITDISRSRELSNLIIKHRQRKKENAARNTVSDVSVIDGLVVVLAPVVSLVRTTS